MKVIASKEGSCLKLTLAYDNDQQITLSESEASEALYHITKFITGEQHA